jgi:hypothetical protein
VSRPVRDAFRVQRLQIVIVVIPLSIYMLVAQLQEGFSVWFPATLGVLLLPTLHEFYRDRYGRRLASAARRFRTVVSPRFVLHHDPELAPFEAALFARVCEDELDTLEQLFGTRLRAWRLWTGRLRVYLFATAPEVSRVHGSAVGGYAECPRWAVVAGADNIQWREFARHELAHIFAGRWNLYAPRLLAEGLAVWAERPGVAGSVDRSARRALPDDSDPLARLLNPEWPDDPQELFGEYYPLAGSFTGYLIRRFGWPAYRRFYQTIGTRQKSFARRFERHFGVPLNEVSRYWTEELRRIPESVVD